MTSSPQLYYCPRTRSAAAGWMNEELGAPCEIKLINIRKDEQDAPAYLSINPMGKVPALVHEDEVITESAAICAYLADAFPEKGLAPKLDDPKRGAYYRWLFYAPSCIEPAMLDKFAGTERANSSTAGHGSMDDVVRTIDHALERSPYLLGEQFSAADVGFGSTLNFAMMFGAIEKKQSYLAYIERLTARPAFRAAQEKEAAWASELGIE